MAVEAVALKFELSEQPPLRLDAADRKFFESEGPDFALGSGGRSRKVGNPIVTGDAAEASSAIVAANAAVNNNFTD